MERISSYLLTLSQTISGIRNIFAGQTAAFVLPIIDKIGIAATGVLAATIGWIGFAYVEFLSYSRLGFSMEVALVLTDNGALGFFQVNIYNDSVWDEA